jgi:hypothetical protein
MRNPCTSPRVALEAVADTCVATVVATAGTVPVAIALAVAVFGHVCCRPVGVFGYVCCRPVGLFGYVCCRPLEVIVVGVAAGATAGMAGECAAQTAAAAAVAGPVSAAVGVGKVIFTAFSTPACFVCVSHFIISLAGPSGATSKGMLPS